MRDQSDRSLWADLMIRRKSRVQNEIITVVGRRGYAWLGCLAQTSWLECNWSWVIRNKTKQTNKQTNKNHKGLENTENIFIFSHSLLHIWRQNVRHFNPFPFFLLSFWVFLTFFLKIILYWNIVDLQCC